MLRHCWWETSCRVHWPASPAQPSGWRWSWQLQDCSLQLTADTILSWQAGGGGGGSQHSTDWGLDTWHTSSTLQFSPQPHHLSGWVVRGGGEGRGELCRRTLNYRGDDRPPAWLCLNQPVNKLVLTRSRPSWRWTGTVWKMTCCVRSKQSWPS